jgi:hypothetical protein
MTPIAMEAPLMSALMFENGTYLADNAAGSGLIP